MFTLKTYFLHYDLQFYFYERDLGAVVYSFLVHTIWKSLFKL